ncbi:MAG TPA: M55 family metallopeptidase [Gemmatimonadales bacterium]|nr:M55 family metallopeptidase [Gemmatimonadales bacterium]
MRLCLLFLTAFMAAPDITAASAQQRPLVVYISADMEGIAGLSSTDDPLGPRFMTAEVNAAIAGAFNAGATRVTVNDAHGSHANLLVDQLDPRITLIRGSLKPYGMMQGLDSTFSAVVFVGYHGRARTLGGFAAHTGSGTVADLRINGTSVGEGGMNTLFAGWYGVPVAFISGDSLAIAQQRALTPGVVGVTVKAGIWDRAVRSLTPDSARAAIQRGVEQALRGAVARPAALTRPIAVELDFSTAIYAEVAEGIPGVRRLGYATVSFSTPDYPAAYRMIRVLYRHLQP